MNVVAIQVRWELTIMPGFQHDLSTTIPTGCSSPLGAVRLANDTSNLSRKASVEHIVDSTGSSALHEGGVGSTSPQTSGGQAAAVCL